MVACGGSGSGGGGPTTGQVVVTLTDGPTDIYERMLVTITSMTLIGSGGQQVLYDGPPVTFDLLQLRDRADLAFSQRVTAGDFSKIRLELAGLTLMDLGDDPLNPIDDVVVVLDNLPANGKIDLNPQGPFTVTPGETTVIELDMDARRSVQVVENGNGGLKVRPVIFTNIYQGDVILPSRLVRVFGTVEAVNETAQTMKVCETEFVAQLDGPAPVDPTSCIQIFANGASHFGTDGVAIPFADIVTAFNASDSLKVTSIGFASLPGTAAADDIVLELDAVVDELGPRRDNTMAGWETTTGTVTSDPFTTGCASSQCVDFLASEAGADITVQLQAESRVFTRDGTELGQGDLSAGLAGAFDGLRVDNGGTEELRASLFVAGPDAGDATVSGRLTAVDLDVPFGTNTFDILTVHADGVEAVEVCVTADTDVLRILTDGATVTIADLLDPAVLDPEVLNPELLDPADYLLIEASGAAIADPDDVCDIDAAVVIVEDPAA
ncbi:MAG: DUF4382 domain-containing protein [Chromatiales bacterium]|nr:MAG: DUF4382 domain-containing protein [Chromatiales bacterium]